MAVKTSRTMDIAKEIMNQIKALDCWYLPAVGAERFYAIGEDDKFIGGLGFQVEGFNHQGWVLIKLTWADEYEIIFVNRDRKVVKVIGGVHFPELIEVLDWVEEG